MRRLHLPRLLPSLLAALTLFALAPMGNAQDAAAPITAAQKKDVIEAVGGIIEKDAFVPNVDFKEWQGFLVKQQSAIDKASTDYQFGAAVQKALNSFGFSHMYLMTPQMVDSRQKHRVVGIGIMIAPDPAGILIVRVFPGSPAEKNGLVAGDIIVGVEGKKAETSAAIRGEEGTAVHIEVQHANGKREKYTMLRASYSTAEPASLVFADPETAVITIPTFDLTYDRTQVETLMKKAASAKNLVVDLRGNPGGSVLNMMHFLGLVLPDGTPIGTFVTGQLVHEYQRAYPGKVDVVKVARTSSNHLLAHAQKVPYYTGTVAVLINGGSGSAAEMTAAALHDLRGATVVGSKSAGAVLISTLRRLPDGFELQFPLADYVTTNGVRLEGTGVTPDFKVTDPKIPGRDKDQPLDRAIAIIEKLDSQRSSLLAPAA